MPSNRRISTRLVCQNAVIPPVGGVNFAGYLADSTGVPASPMRILGKYATVYLLHGSGRYRDANGVDMALRPGDFILVFPDLPHSYGPAPGEEWDEFYIVFDGPVFHAWRDAGLISSSRPVFHLEPIEYWLRRFVSAAGESTAGNVPLGLMGAVRMQQLLADIVTVSDPQADAGWITAAKAMLDEDALRPHANFPAVAKRLSMGYETFRKRFTSLAGMSPNRYRNSRVMDRAIQLLADPDVLLRTAAEECGFCDEFHFSKRFKQIIGMSPSEFRRRLR